MIDYLREENRVLQAELRGKRLRLSDDERRRLAVKAQALGREALAQLRPLPHPLRCVLGVSLLGYEEVHRGRTAEGSGP